MSGNWFLLMSGEAHPPAPVTSDGVEVMTRYCWASRELTPEEAADPAAWDAMRAGLLESTERLLAEQGRKLIAHRFQVMQSVAPAAKE